MYKQKLTKKRAINIGLRNESDRSEKRERTHFWPERLGSNFASGVSREVVEMGFEMRATEIDLHRERRSGRERERERERERHLISEISLKAGLTIFVPLIKKKRKSTIKKEILFFCPFG